MAILVCPLELLHLLRYSRSAFLGVAPRLQEQSPLFSGPEAHGLRVVDPLGHGFRLALPVPGQVPQVFVQLLLRLVGVVPLLRHLLLLLSRPEGALGPRADALGHGAPVGLVLQLQASDQLRHLCCRLLWVLAGLQQTLHLLLWSHGHVRALGDSRRDALLLCLVGARMLLDLLRHPLRLVWVVALLCQLILLVLGSATEGAIGGHVLDPLRVHIHHVLRLLPMLPLQLRVLLDAPLPALLDQLQGCAMPAAIYKVRPVQPQHCLVAPRRARAGRRRPSHRRRCTNGLRSSGLGAGTHSGRRRCSTGNRRRRGL
mmetsp:Transcript_95375/g.273491  ORF Transcript_95375/g.273491 Transcript_95375/m.273491 type:complete len:314 (-) Transcript_95375:2-943(-)